MNCTWGSDRQAGMLVTELAGMHGDFSGDHPWDLAGFGFDDERRFDIR